jgi:transposase InsO family protein
LQPKSYRPRTTDSRHALGYSPNLLLDAPPPECADQVWVGDITYVPLVGGAFLYLAHLMDRFSRRLVGWELQHHLRETLVLAAVRSAIARRRPGPGLIHHSDRGGQSAGRAYRAVSMVFVAVIVVSIFETNRRQFVPLTLVDEVVQHVSKRRLRKTTTTFARTDRSLP